MLHHCEVPRASWTPACRAWTNFIFRLIIKGNFPGGEAKEKAVELQPTHHRAQLSPSARMAVPRAKCVWLGKGRKCWAERRWGEKPCIWSVIQTSITLREGTEKGQKGRMGKRRKGGRHLMCALEIKIQQNFFPFLCLFMKPLINVLSIAVYMVHKNMLKVDQLGRLNTLNE